MRLSFGGRVLYRTVFLSMAIAKLIACADGSQIIRQSEAALAKALNTKDTAILTALTDQGFHVYWTAGSAVRHTSAEMVREEWIHRMTQLPIASYTATISNINLVRRDEALVDVDECWNLRSPQGSRIRRCFHTRDTWLKLQGVWKLTGRISHTDTR